MSVNHYLRRAAQKNKPGNSGRYSERRVAKEIGANLQPASGALSNKKGDMVFKKRDTKFLVEAKSTQTDTLALDIGWLMKITSESLGANAKPMIVVSFVDHQGNRRGPSEDWVVIPMSLFGELCED